MPYYAIDDVAQYIRNRVETNKVALGLAATFYADDGGNITRFPSAVVVPGPMERTGHAIRMVFELGFTVYIFILHADLTKTQSQRTSADLALARAVTLNLHADYTLGGNVITGFISREEPRTLPMGMGRSIIGTQLTWVGTQREL